MERRASIALQRPTVNLVPGKQSAAQFWMSGFIASGSLWVIFVSFVGMPQGLSQGMGRIIDEARLYKETVMCSFKVPVAAEQ